MKIHEYQSKEILRKFEIPTPNGILVYTADSALEAAKQLGGSRWAVKAQIQAGGRGKAGGIKIANNFNQVKEYSQYLLNTKLKTHQTQSDGQPVHRLLIENALNFNKEYYIGIVTDRFHQLVTIIASNQGGMDIEEIAENKPEKIIKIYINPLIGLTDAMALDLVKKIEIPENVQIEMQNILKKLYRVYMKTDASLVEINPLIIEENGSIKALDAKFNFDPNALFRHPEILAYRDFDEEDPIEIEASKFGLSYIALDGNIGCLVNGAGLAMATMDIIKLFNGEPANFLDVGGGATVEKVTEAFRIMLLNKNIQSILVNIFGGIMRCDTIANGIVTACQSVNINVPLIVRMRGTNEILGQKILSQSGIPIINATTMEDAAIKAVTAIKNN